ncbi:uncharacterized protein LOC130784072 [Actinidia eriantha]|uniref:uncharacterized protein LOC130784072 n=1 Tax=Actinidia eriantha TaxID=165200 RepID=UPI00258EB03B|nr:uncharacterized protein LOC130784072 [Actinidia eriantha]
MANVVDSTDAADQKQQKKEERRHRSIFDVPSDFFDSCRLLQFPNSSPEPFETSANETLGEEVVDDERHSAATTPSVSRWSCNTCKAEFESLQDQRSHFKSDIHRFNVKLTIAGKETVNEEDFDELTTDSLFKDNDISSISGSEDEAEKGSVHLNDMLSGLSRSVKQKLFIRLHGGERVSIWKCSLLDEADNILFDNDKSVSADDGGLMPCLREKEVIGKLKTLIHEPRNNTRLRVVLLASGGHFAACVFDGNSVVAHKTYHRYVVRAKAGKKQSSKDASGRAAHSAGASLRRHNELALKKEIQELLASWKPYFDASSCVFIYAPSNNRQLLFDGEKPCFSCKHCVVRNVPLTVRRPTFKESRRVYNLLTQVSYEVVEETTIKEDSVLSISNTNDGCPGSTKEDFGDLESRETTEACSGVKNSDILSISSESESEGKIASTSTDLHEAAKSGNPQKVLELLEQGSDPCIKDERGRTPYMLATEKEVRNIFRRFMALNPDKWDWHAANVPSALTKEMEESQAAKQTEKDAKKKARAKELKKLRKAREKKIQADAALSQGAPSVSENRVATPISVSKGRSQSISEPQLSKEELLRRAQAEEREKRAAAAERRMAAAAVLNSQGTGSNTAPSSSQPKGAVTTDVKCSCCDSSLLGKVPFHRYNYKYCSTSCMHVHREMLEDG